MQRHLAPSVKAGKKNIVLNSWIKFFCQEEENTVLSRLMLRTLSFSVSSQDLELSQAVISLQIVLLVNLLLVVSCFTPPDKMSIVSFMGICESSILEPWRTPCWFLLTFLFLTWTRQLTRECLGQNQGRPFFIVKWLFWYTHRWAKGISSGAYLVLWRSFGTLKTILCILMEKQALALPDL